MFSAGLLPAFFSSHRGVSGVFVFLRGDVRKQLFARFVWRGMGTKGQADLVQGWPEDSPVAEEFGPSDVGDVSEVQVSDFKTDAEDWPEFNSRMRRAAAAYFASMPAPRLVVFSMAVGLTTELMSKALKQSSVDWFFPAVWTFWMGRSRGTESWSPWPFPPVSSKA
jgi:hypothetical protein